MGFTLALILRKVILPPKRCFRLLVLVGKIGPEARAEVNMPAPETADGRFGILVIMCAELAVLAGVFLFSHITRFLLMLRLLIFFGTVELAFLHAQLLQRNSSLYESNSVGLRTWLGTQRLLLQ